MVNMMIYPSELRFTGSNNGGNEMDYREYDRVQVHMGELQPWVPEWAKAEQMEMSMPQSEIWERAAGIGFFAAIRRKIFRKHDDRELKAG